MPKNKNMPAPNDTFNEFLLYTTSNGKVKVIIFLHNENIWLTQDKIALLFSVQRPAITRHLKNIFESGELIENSVCSILEHTATDGKIRKTNVSIAKNYLNEDEMDNLNRIVTMYLDYAELQAKNRKLMTMADWIGKLDAFLQFNEKDILTNAGKITAEIAKSFAETEYEKYRVIPDRLMESDFDQHVKRLIEKKGEPNE